MTNKEKIMLGYCVRALQTICKHLNLTVPSEEQYDDLNKEICIKANVEKIKEYLDANGGRCGFYVIVRGIAIPRSIVKCVRYKQTGELKEPDSDVTLWPARENLQGIYELSKASNPDGSDSDPMFVIEDPKGFYAEVNSEAMINFLATRAFEEVLMFFRESPEPDLFTESNFMKLLSM